MPRVCLPPTVCLVARLRVGGIGARLGHACVSVSSSTCLSHTVCLSLVCTLEHLHVGLHCTCMTTNGRVRRRLTCTTTVGGRRAGKAVEVPEHGVSPLPGTVAPLPLASLFVPPPGGPATPRTRCTCRNAPPPLALFSWGGGGASRGCLPQLCARCSVTWGQWIMDDYARTAY